MLYSRGNNFFRRSENGKRRKDCERVRREMRINKETVVVGKGEGSRRGGRRRMHKLDKNIR